MSNKRKGSTSAEASPHKKAKHADGEDVASVDDPMAMWRAATIGNVIDSERKGRRVITFDHNDSVRHVLTVLGQHSLTSAPVITNTGGRDEADAYVGVISVQDILRGLFTRVLRDQESADGSIGAEHLAELSAKGKELLDSMAITALGSDVDLVLDSSVSHETPLGEVIRNHFVPPPAGEDAPRRRAAHRIALFDAHGRIHLIVSQSDVVRWLAAHQSHVPEFLDSDHINELGLVKGVGSMISVAETVNAATAFAKMFESGVSGIGVCDANGHVVDVVSASDLRGLLDVDLAALALPVREYLSAKHPMRRALVTIKPTARFSELLRTFASTKVHRVFVVDANDKPHGVITLTDVLAVLARIDAQ